MNKKGFKNDVTHVSVTLLKQDESIRERAKSIILKTLCSLARIILKNFNMRSKDVSCQVDYWDFLWPERRFKPKQETNSEIMAQEKRFI